MQPVFFDPTAEPPPTPVDSLNQPIQDQLAAHEHAMDQWRAESTRAIDSHLLDFDSFEPGYPVQTRRRALVESYLDVRTNPATNEVSHAMRRARVAREAFQGRGAESDDDFFAEIQREATERKDLATLHRDLAAAATRHQLLRATGDPRASESDWLAWKAGALADPAFKLADEPSLMEAWVAERARVADLTAPFQYELGEIWSGYQNGVTNFFGVADSIPPDQRGDFKNALATLVRALPAEEQPAFWANLRKQAGRDLTTNTITALDSVFRGADTFREASLGGPSRTAEEQFAFEQSQAEDRRRRDFLDEIRTLAEQEFDPVTPVPGGLPDWIERGLYAAPGVAATTLTAVVPYAGPVATVGIIREDFYQTTRRDLISQGVDPADASAFAGEIATVGAVPATLLERLGARAVTGQLPALNRLLTRAADRLGRNAVARAATRATGGAAFETGVEITQDLMGPLVQEVAAALSEDIHGVDWQDTLAASWARIPETFVAILPLSIAMAGGAGPARDRRNAAFAAATDLELLAFGFSPARIREIRDAQGPESLDQAVAAAAAEHDDSSETAIDATQELAEELLRQRQAIERAQATGILPRFEEKGGVFTLYDGVTGEEIGKAPNEVAALRLAAARTRSIDLDSDSHLDSALREFLSTQLEGVAALSDGNTATDFGPGRRVTPAQEAAESPEAEARIAWQSRSRAELETGSPAIAEIVLGQYIPDTRRNVRDDVIKLNQGAALPTLIHEKGHQWFRRAIETGALSHAETLAIVRSVQANFQAKSRGKKKTATAFHYLPQNDAEVTIDHLDEAVAEILEAEVIRTRKGDGPGKLPGGLVSRNFAAIIKLAGGPENRFATFLRAAKDYFRLVLTRANQLTRGLKDGSIDPDTYQGFLNTLLGLDEQTDFEQQARDAEAAILDDADLAPIPEGDPFSLGIDPTQPGGAGNTSDAASPSSVVTPEMDAAYLAAVEAGDMGTAQRMADKAENSRPRYYWRGTARKSETKEIRDGLQIVSRNHADGSSEKGMSVSQSFGAVAFHGYPYAYLVSGEEIGTGADGEPVLSNVSPVSAAMPLASANQFHHRQMKSDPLYKKRNTLVSVKGRFGSRDTYADEAILQLVANEERMANITDRMAREITSESSSNLEKALAEEGIKRADPVTYDASGNVIPLSQRFNQSSPAAPGDTSYSLAPSAVADALRLDAISRIRDPERRAKAYQRLARKLEELSLTAERLELLGGTPRQSKSLRREAATREALRAEQLENETLARHHEILSNEDLAKLSAQPLHAFFSKPGPDGRPDPLHGELESIAAWKRRTGRHLPPPEYEDSAGVSPTVFGGTLAPDQAARDAHAAGLIRTDSVAALWDALRTERRHADRMKERLARAKADLATARRQAKSETNAWLARQQAEHTARKPAHARQEITAAIAVYEGILAVMPPDVRARLGGFTRLASLPTNEARLKYLQDRLRKADKELETWLKDTLGDEFRKLLDAARPDKPLPGEKPRGKVTADVHELFQAIEDAMGLDAADVESKARELETLAADPDTTADREAHLNLQAHFVRLTGDWLRADAARREMALLEATRIFTGGYADALYEAAKRRERRQAFRSRAIAETGKNGSPLALDRMRETEALPAGKAAKMRFGFYSFEQVLDSVFGQNSASSQYFADWERAAHNRKADAIQNKLDLVETFLADLAGGKFKGEQLRYELSRPRTIQAGGGKTGATARELSQLEAIQATLLWRQEDGKRHMIGHLDLKGEPNGPWHYNQAFIDQLEAQLTPEAKALRHHLAEQYAAEYEQLNAVFRDLYGINLPRHKHYSPITVMPVQAKAGEMTDPVTGQSTSGIGLTPGSLRTRSTTAVAQPNFRDALQTYLGHSMQMEHWMAYAPMVTEAMAILNARTVGDAVTEKAGEESLRTLRDWINYFATGGNQDAANFIAANQAFSRATNRLAAAALVGRISVLAIQATQLGAGLAEMPTGAFLTRLAKLTTGQLGWGRAMKSDLIQRRLQDMPPAVRQALDGLNSTKPRRLKTAIRALGRTIAGADALFTAGTYAITYDYHLANAPAGLTDPQRHEHAKKLAERSTERVAQPTRPGTRSLFEVRSTNPAARLLWSFSSEARQKLFLTINQLAETYQNTEGSTAKKLAAATLNPRTARVAAVTWIAGGVVASLIRAAIRDVKSDDDDEWFDDRNWDPKRMALQSLMGPLYGIPILGEEAERGIMSAAGEWTYPGGTLFSSMADAPGSAVDLFQALSGMDDEADLDSVLRDIESIAEFSAIFSESGAAASSVMHTIRDGVGIIQNLTPD